MEKISVFGIGFQEATHVHKSQSYSFTSSLLPLTAVIALLQMNVAVSSASSNDSASISASSLDVVISEIAWMGTTTDANDEWLELANNTGVDIDLSGWRLVSSDGTSDITLAGIIPAGGRFLLERTDDATTPNLADQIYTGALVNTGEVLTLTDNLSESRRLVAAQRGRRCDRSIAL